MSTIKKSHLKEVFSKYGISEGIFDIFNKKRKSLEKKLKDVQADIQDTINSAPSKAEKEQLRRLAAAFDKAKTSGVFDK